MSRVLFFHAPCFDGLVSAAMGADFLKTARGWNELTLRGVNYDIRSKWLKMKAAEPFAVVDFLYHPDASFWVDHHLTTFLTPTLQRSYERKHSTDLVYDRDAPSCSVVIWRHLRKVFGYRNSRFSAMVDWANRIDAAKYHSVEEVFDGSDPALRINLALTQFSGTDDCEQLATFLTCHDLAEAAQLPFVRKRAERAKRLSLEGLKRFQKSARLKDDIVVFDVDAGKSMVSRYAPYRFFPHARYSAGIIRSGNGVKITAMRNPWRQFKSVPLGKIFQRVGGGGHERVGSVVLKPSEALQAGRVLDQVVTSIRNHERFSHRST